MLAETSGRLRGSATTAAELPVVGDWVAVAPRTGEASATIHHVLPRWSSFSRKVAGATTREQVVAANVDTIFLVSGLDGDFNLRRIERYVTLGWNSGALPVIILNKADLCDDLDARVADVQSVAPGIDVVVVSAADGHGISKLEPYLKPGNTIAFLGSSGVGKSTLVNRLAGDDLQKTLDVREDDSRGRHTTTFRELFVIDGGAILIDTPGMRELQLWSDSASVSATFSDIEELAEQCRFTDCQHDTEPGCAVADALERGILDSARFANFVKLRKEVAFLDKRKSEPVFEKRKRERTQSKLYKSVQRHNRKHK